MTSELSFDWKLVNRLPKIQSEAEFSEVMSENFVGSPPSEGTRNYAHGGKGPFRTSGMFLFAKITSEFVLAKCQVNCTY